MGLLMGQNTWLKLLDGFSPKFYGIASICIRATSWSPAHSTNICLPMGRNAYLWNIWIDLLCSKFHGISSTCSCATSWLSVHWPIWGCPFDPYGPAHGPQCVLLKLLDVFSPFDILWNCPVFNRATSWSFATLNHIGLPMVAHLIHMDLPMDQNAYLWNHLMDFPSSKLWCGIVQTCGCAASWAYANLGYNSAWYELIWIAEIAWFLCMPALSVSADFSKYLGKKLKALIATCPGLQWFTLLKFWVVKTSDT